MEDQEYWGNPKIYKRNLYSSLLFLFIAPIYGIYSLGFSVPKLIIVLFLCGIPGLYFLNIYRKYKNKPVLITNTTSITITDPFSKVQTVLLKSIKSVKQTSNGIIKLKTDSKPKTLHINGKVLFESDKKMFLEFIENNITNI